LTFYLQTPKKKKSPKWGLKNKTSTSDHPQESVRKKHMARIPALDAMNAEAFSGFPNDLRRLKCPSTAAWYRWDFPIPNQPMLCDSVIV